MRQGFVFFGRHSLLTYAFVCTACGGAVEGPTPTESSTAELALATRSSSWTQTFASDAGDVSPLHVAVDRRDQTFVLACVGACDAGDRFFARVDARGRTVFSKQLRGDHETTRLDQLAVSKDGRIGLAGDLVAPDGTTRFTVAIFSRDGRLEWQANDHAPAHALDAVFDAKGDFIVVGAATDGSGLAVAFDPRGRRHVAWRFGSPHAAFSRVRTDARGGVSIAGTVPSGGFSTPAQIWRLEGRGHLAWTYTPPAPTASVTLAVDDAGDSAFVSTKFHPTTTDGETPVAFVTTLLDVRGTVRWISQLDFQVTPAVLLDAAFSPCGDVTVFGRTRAGGRITFLFDTARFDANGNTIWLKNDEDFGFLATTPAAMALGSDGDVAEVGVVLADLNQPGKGWIALYGNDGSLLGTESVPAMLVDVARDSADGIVTLGHLDATTVVTRQPELGTP